MAYLLVEPKVKALAPNIALMKLAKWCETNGHDYQYVRGRVEPRIEPDNILMSCTFSYRSLLYKKTIDYYLKRFPGAKLTVGGVFPSLNPGWFDNWNGAVAVHKGLYERIEPLAPKYDVEITSEDDNPYPRDKIVLYASRGCINKCAYCAVPKLEGDMRAFETIKTMLQEARVINASSVVLFDNNLTAHPYFDTIIDDLVDLNLPVDIHGLHVEGFTRHHAKRLSELSWCSQGDNGTPYLRFSFDKLKYADGIRKALEYIVDENVKAQFFCYLLFNWMDSPEEFWERIQIAQTIVDEVGESIFLFPQRYEPLNALERNQHVGKHWNSVLLKGIVRLYTQIRGFIPITRSRNVYDWIGHSKEEFLKKILDLGNDMNIKPAKTASGRSDQDLKVKFHPAANIFPMMNAEDYEGLKSDIEKHGLIEPIQTYQGKIIDGRNRYLACCELGIDPQLELWQPSEGIALIDYVIAMNLKRRHLNASQKAFVAVDALPFYEQEAKTRQKLSKGRGKKGVAKVPQVNFGKSRDKAANVLGVSGRYVGYAKQIIRDNPDIASKIREGKKTIAQALSQIDRQRRTEIMKNIRKGFRSSKDLIFVDDDFFDWCRKNIDDNSVDLVFTKPPVDQQSLHLLERVSREAKRILKPSSYFIVYCEIGPIEKLIHLLSRHLTYNWLYCVEPNISKDYEETGIIKDWQGALVYFKPPLQKKLASGNNNTDAAGKWGRSNQDMVDSDIMVFMDTFSDPNELVLDPFVGRGQVYDAARKLKRKFIGFDLEPD